jgi:HK97 family phage major capsid protein
MPNYTSQQQRGDSAALTPEQILTNAILDALPQASLVLGAGTRRVPLSRNQARMPVLATLPEAYWVNGDTGLKETTRAQWTNKYINVEELAVIVPIPENVIEDSDYDILAAIQPLVVEAVGAKIDAAVLFGISKPASWDFGGLDPSHGLAQTCEAVGNVVNQGAHVYADLIATTKEVATDGHPVTAYLADALYEYELLGEVDSLGRPLFVPTPTADGVSALLGRQFRYLNNGAWQPGYKLIAGDLQNLIVGIRRDVTWEVFREGVITDSNGVVLFNLMQQDSRALRMTMRIGVAVGNPKRRRSKDFPHPYPFATLKSA